MRKNYSLLLLLPLAIGCQDRLAVQGAGNSYVDAQSSNDVAVTVQVSSPLTFVSQTDFSAWTEIRGIEERFKACDVPDVRLRMMTTSALVQSVLHYPLNYLVFAYNDPQEAVRLVYENSALHRELASRPDAAEELIRAFSASDMALNSNRVSSINDNEALSYIDGMFLEYFLGSGLVSGLSSGTNRTALRDAVRRKLELRSADTLTYSSNSLMPLYGIDSRENLRIVTSVNGGEFVRYQTVYTYFRKPIVGMVRTEFSSQEIANLNNSAQTQYPNATMRGPASAKYNCHSYAWHNSSTDNALWIDAEYEHEFQLSKYWTSDLYVSCPSSEAIKAHYSSGNHSANILSSGKYLSKWGNWPLMEHDYDYCPYVLSNIQFFSVRNQPLYKPEAQITGDATVRPNTLHEYSVSDPDLDLTYQWSVAYMDNLATTPGTCEFTVLDDKKCRLKCYEYGLYKLKAYGYYGNNCVSWTELNVISMEF